MSKREVNADMLYEFLRRLAFAQTPIGIECLDASFPTRPSEQEPTADARVAELEAWSCSDCGARFASSVNPILLDGVHRCSSCVRAEAAEARVKELEARQ